MIRILSEEFLHPNELEILIWLLDSGLDYYHFRKKNIEHSILIEFLENIPFQYKRKVVLHHPLSLNGFLYHHKSFERSTVNPVHSCSTHQLTEVKEYVRYYKHIFWSPVFDSISKLGYAKNTEIQLNAIPKLYHKQVIALGGVEPIKFAEIKQMGFSQIAVKGWFWNQQDYKQAWEKIQTTWQELEKRY